MKKTFILFIFLSAACFAQKIKIVEVGNEEVILAKSYWGDDVQIVDRELIGKMDAVQVSDGTIYLAINDNIAGQTTGLKIRKSSDNGMTWRAHYLALEPAIKFENLKIIKDTADVIYVFFQMGNDLLIWNILNMNVQSINIPALRAWDVAVTSSGTFYLFYDANNILTYQASVDCGYTWINQTTVSSNGAYPKLSKSRVNDDLALIYYNGISPDITTREIGLITYMETSPGVLSSTVHSAPVLAGQNKTEIGAAVNQGRMWIVYTVRIGDSLDIIGKYSDDLGATFSGEVNIASDPNNQEYWFDIKASNYSPFSFDLVFYSDYLQTGFATNETDKLCATVSVQEGFDTPFQISQNFPYWSSIDFVPRIVELPYTSSGTFGAVWVGYNGTNSGLYWDEYSAISPVEYRESVPSNFQLDQNYPNPFNPSTLISYDLHRNSNVTIKVYDLLGREVATLVNEYKTAGRYKLTFDTKKYSLSSGIYYYRMQAENFVDTKKLVILK
jgi:hypothetical protein